MSEAIVEVEDPGPRATVQDLGRPGYAQLGVGRSGAADRGALRLANRLVGNPEGVAALELTLGGLRARFHGPALVAVTGAPCRVDVLGDDRSGEQEPNNNRPDATREPRPPRADGGMDAPFHVRPGQTLSIGVPWHGLRSYVAVRGGIDVPPVLGSRSTDTLSGIGPPVLAAGTALRIGDETAAFPTTDLAVERRPPAGAPFPIRLGPREDWFTPRAIATLVSQPYTVRPETDRVGARLDGPALERRWSAELRSEGMVLGALQVPPDGRPILFLADHPVTGGYPVIAVLRPDGLDRAAQLRPGDGIRFRLSRR